MSEIFGAFGWTAAIGKYAMWGGYLFLFLIIALVITAMAVWIVVIIKSKKIIEINLVTRQVEMMMGRFKKHKSGQRRLWIGKLKKFMPIVQQDDYYHRKNKDIIFLVKDKNGLHHTARLPAYSELLSWYKQVHEIDLEKTTDNSTADDLAERLKTIYMMPNPSESLDGIADECVEADKEFAPVWWKSPAMMWIATAAICAFTLIITFMIAKKM